MTTINRVSCPQCFAPVGEPCRRTRLARFFGKRGAVLHDRRVNVYLGYLSRG